MRFIYPEIKVLPFTGIVVDWKELNVNGILEKMRELLGSIFCCTSMMSFCILTSQHRPK